MHWFRPSTALAAALFLTAPALLPQTQAQTPKQPVAHGIAVQNLDPSVEPGNDFFRYANGAWVARTRIPADRPSIGVFATLLDESRRNAFAQNWASKARPAALRRQVLTDPHAPARFRAATVRNSDAWYEAFGVRPGDALYLSPDKRVRIW